MLWLILCLISTTNDSKTACFQIVSIHAPTRGATATARMEFLEVLFQSTHPHGVRLFYTTMTRIRTCFNPRTHTGCDKYQRLCLTSLQRFNPRTHTGCDEVKFCAEIEERMFQSTHPHGVRLNQINQSVGSRVSIHAPTRGATEALSVINATLPVSIHAPTRGATLSRPHSSRDNCFNPRTHTGCDRLILTKDIDLMQFQSTHPHGVRPS